MTAAVREEPQICLFVKQKIDDYRLDMQEFCLYTRISRRTGNSKAWQSIANMARACYVGLSRARKTWRLLNLAEITQ